MADRSTSRKCLLCRIGYSLVGIAIGVSAFIVWLVVFEHTKATIHIVTFSGLSAVLAAWNLVTHIMHLQDYWRTWLRGLRYFMACGALFSIIAIAGFITYLVLGIKAGIGVTVGSFYISCVWCFITFKWAFLLLLYSRSYRNEFSDLTALLEF
ncbi:heme transporter hrg1-A-like [Styela clava]|uniref:heme transporter hrg1-A-like n=1 Tax=Styela clava TaxID=7725 RepID=UPI001939B17D|nr:heme transporter hrg1-A-like [Styela clava]